jgi:hemerythrin
MLIRFTNDLLIGNETIDNQHQEWFKRLDNFWSAAKQNKGKEEVVRTLVFLIEYVEYHFADEERIQQESNYPGCAQHKQQHDWFRNKTEEMVRDLQSQGPNFPITVETLNSMLEWTVNHIKKMDMDMAKYIKPRNQAPNVNIKTLLLCIFNIYSTLFSYFYNIILIYCLGVPS